MELTNLIEFFSFLFGPYQFIIPFIAGGYIIYELLNFIDRKYDPNKIITVIFGILLLFLLHYLFLYQIYGNNSIFFILKFIFSIPLILFVPGNLLYNLSFKENKKVDLAETVFIQILISILISGLVGLFLAIVGIFSLFSLITILLSFSIAIILKFNCFIRIKSYRKNEERFQAFVLLGIILISIALFFHPFESIIGGRDPGVYINSGVNIAKTGSITIQDNLIASLNPEDFDNIFIREDFQETPSQYLGYYIIDANQGEISQRFFYLYPIWIAIFYSIFESPLFLYITPIVSLLSVIAIFFTVRRLFNQNVALLSIFLLSINYAQIWYSRYPSSEILMQLLIFSGIYFLLMFNKNKSSLFAIFSALCFAEVFFTRIEGILVLLPIMVFSVHSWINNKITRRYVAFLIIYFSLIPIYVFLTYNLISNYILDILNYSNYIIIISLASIVVFILIIKKYGKNRIKNIVYINENIWKFVLSALTIALFVYYYYLRPEFFSGFQSDNLLKIMWYIPPSFSVLLIAGGVILAIQKKMDENLMLFLMFIFIFTIIFIDKTRISPDHPWWIRRFLALTIPSFIIFLSYFTIEFNWKKHEKIISTVKILIVLFISFSFMNLSSQILDYQEYKGIIKQSEEFTEFFEGDILLFGNDLLGHWFATPFRYIFDLNVLMVWQVKNIDIYENMIENWIGNNKEVYFINPPKEIICNLSKTNLEYIRSNVISFPVLIKENDRIPDNIMIYHAPLSLYKFGKLNDKKEIEIPFELNIGVNDECYIEGFYGPDMARASYRWSTGHSNITLPISTDESEDLKIILGFTGYRPDDNPAEIEIKINGYSIGNLTKKDGDINSTLLIDKEYLKPESLRIDILSDTWIPRKYGLSDDRRLGVALYFIRIEKADSN